mgnify:CR=1 FL=1
MHLKLPLLMLQQLVVDVLELLKLHLKMSVKQIFLVNNQFYVEV